MCLIKKWGSKILRRLQDNSNLRNFLKLFSDFIVVKVPTENEKKELYVYFSGAEKNESQIRINPNVINLIAKCWGEFAGFVQLLYQEPGKHPYPGYWLCNLYVKTAFRGFGIGERLTETVIEKSRLKGADVVNLFVYEDNDRAVKLYKKLGFEKSNIQELYPPFLAENQKSGHRVNLMQKKLLE